MKSKQTKAITRLVEIKRRKADAAEAAHAAANAATVAAERLRIDADVRWLAALDVTETIGTAADLELRDLHVRALRHAVDEAERFFSTTRSQQSAARAAMTEARVELRRFETWLDREAEATALERRRVERIAEDEVATRKAKTG